MPRFLLLCLLSSALCPLAPAADKPVPTKEAAGKMKLPDGFKVQLFAGEPDIVQPIAFTFDDRGRMWVVECLMYPKWSQDGKGGKDRVVILEDTDGDGVHDKKTVVIDDGVNLSGIELGFGGMYLCSSPNLIFVPIKDDKPGKAEVLLDGWNIKDAKHNVFNALVWGPDGWLYGCNGIQTKSKVGKPGTPDKDRVLFDCGVWRFHPTRKVFEVVATGTTNPWGLDFDEHGEMFITNCVIDHLFHVVPGGRYTRMYGQDYNPHTYGYMGSAVDYKHWGSGAWTDSRADKATGALKKEHDDAGGGHAHSGAAIYLGDNFPKEYRNTLFTANIHGSRLNNDGLERTKTGMKGVRRPDFLFANDPWFRGICVKQGPAGELFVSDWCDTGECHNYDVADTTNGRIYRVTYGDLKPFKGDVSKMTDEELVKAVTGKNEWLSRKARRVLQERGDKAEKAFDALLAVTRSKESPGTVLRATWALHAAGQFHATDYDQLLRHKSEIVRAAVVPLAVESDGWKEPWISGQLLTMLGEDESPLVRRQLASALQRLPVIWRSSNAAKLLARPEDAEDRNLALLHWYALQPLMLSDPDEMLKHAIKAKSNFLRECIVAGYLTRPGVNVKSALASAVVVLVAVPTGEPRAAVLRGIRYGLSGVKLDGPPDGWAIAYATLTDGGGSREEYYSLTDLAVQFGDKKVIDEHIRQLNDRGYDSDGGPRMIESLTRHGVPNLAPVLHKVLTHNDPRGPALRALAAYPDEKTPGLILDLYAKLTADEKADAIQTLASRAAYASALLDAVEKGTVPKADITAFTARQIASLKDKAVVEKLGKVWGEVKPSSTNAKAKTAEYKTKLTADDIAKGDITKGKALFTKNCATCHKLFGEGQAVGPELTGSQRANLDYLLENVVDPNAAVPGDYKMTLFYLKDGRQVSGIVKRDTRQAVVVRAVNEEVTIAKADIDERKATQSSLMPEGLFDALKPDEVRDLVKYLVSKEGK